SDRVAVMYLGKLVEVAPTRQLFSAPEHPYTRALLSAIPVPDPTRSFHPQPLPGELPSPLDPPKGCRFHPRCADAVPICAEVQPALIPYGPGRAIACHVAARRLGLVATGEGGTRVSG
ncbi:MAG: oligopeptide/dipeptide ABC transporter ATP-binding protein, partial [Chloroflexota bacterium]